MFVSRFCKLKGEFFALAFILIGAVLLRTILLGNTFQSADNAALADRIVHHRGYAWMVREYYGFLINFIVKIFAASLSAVGIRLNEFWWKLPMALFGSAQVVLTFFFLRRYFNSVRLALGGAAFIAILPIHVMQSRYLWGYEVLGIFFLTLFIWQWLAFFEQPSISTGRKASVTLAFYLISHGYILPLLPVLFLSLFFLPDTQKQKPHPFKRFRVNLNYFIRFRVWLYPLLFSPLTLGALRRSQQKPLSLGLYPEYFLDFIADTGIFLFLLILLALLLFALKRSGRRARLWLFLILSASYLLPFFVAAPPGITVVGGYMSMGIYWLLLFALAISNEIFYKAGEFAAEREGALVSGDKPEISLPVCQSAKSTESVFSAHYSSCRPNNLAPFKSDGTELKNLWPTAVLTLIFLATAWGTIESIFFGDRLFDPSLVKKGRGIVAPDPGTKAAGYLLHKYLPEEKYPANSWPILVLHRQIEPPCVSYYWRREALAFYDYNFEQTLAAFVTYKNKMALVVADPEQADFVASDPDFKLKIVLYDRGEPCLFLFSRDENFLPEIKAEVKEFNEAFDRELFPRVSFR